MARSIGRLARVTLTLLATLGLVGSGFDVLVPDSHDRDTMVLVAAQGNPAVPTAPVPAPRHHPDAPHVCHCAHSHVAVTDPPLGTLGPITPPTSATTPSQVAVPSISPTAPFRPPIA